MRPFRSVLCACGLAATLVLTGCTGTTPTGPDSIPPSPSGPTSTAPQIPTSAELSGATTTPVTQESSTSPYLAPPKINKATVSGPGTVDLVGENFSTETQVTINGIAADAVTVESSTHIIVAALDLPYGPILVAATTAGGVSQTVTVDHDLVFADGIYAWWTNPIAVNDGETTWLGSIAEKGAVRIAKINNKTGEIVIRTVAQMTPDDHNAPSIAFDPTRPDLLTFFTNHGQDKMVRYRSVNRETAALGKLQSIEFSGNVTYAEVMQVGSRIAILSRIGSTQWGYRISQDFGRTWEPERILVISRGSGILYTQVKALDGSGRYALTVYGHPSTSQMHDILYAEIDFNSGEIVNADGSKIGNLFTDGGPAFLAGSLAAAFVTKDPGGNLRYFDTALINGNPTVTFATWEGVDGPATYRVQMYINGQWTPIPWNLHAGNAFGSRRATYYFGGTAFGAANNLFTIRQDNQTQTWYLEEWKWNSAIGDFEFHREIRHETDDVLARPLVPAGPGKVGLLALQISRYDSYSRYTSNILIY